MRPSIAVCDLDGTLLDSDAALLAPFVALGVPSDDVGWGRPLAEECARHGVEVETYLDLYDSGRARPFPGVPELVDGLDRWAVFSNKHPRSGRDELARLGWSPELAFFTDAFRGPKELGPVLAAMEVDPAEVVVLGDTAHDRRCALDVGATFALAGWNPRARAEDLDVVLREPTELLDLLALGAS